MNGFWNVAPRRWARVAVLCITALVLVFLSAAPSGAAVDRILLSGVPYVAQLPNYCGPAALSSVLAFWGKPVSQTMIATRVFDKRHGATNGADLLLFAREQGFSAYSYFSSVNELKDHLRSGLPVLVLQDLSSVDRRGHFRVVVGFSDITHVFLVRDPNYEEIRRIPYEEFGKVWSSFANWALVVCPKDREVQLDPAIRDNPVLHIDLGQAYLRRKQTDLARENFQESLKLEPQNEEARDLLASLDKRGRKHA